MLIYSLAFSQQEASVWYFGGYSGLDFNTGNPIALSGGQLSTYEGCATISSSDGQLLFYTDGVTVYNRDHQIMENGEGLFGDDSSTQSATIVPKPGSNTLYYIFTLDAFAQENGFAYSVVDISLDGGLGAVTSEKNIILYTPSSEKLAIVKHANTNDYWVVTHGWNNNSFVSYLLTENGLSSSPIISNVGVIVNGSTENNWGAMKISPDGTKIAICNSSIDAELLDFNNQTGEVSNPLVLNTLTFNTGFNYGVEFSPDSKKLYLSIVKYIPQPCQIVQYDLSSSDILGSEVVLLSTFDVIPAALQLAPNNKIYIAQAGTTKLGVINIPNNVGLSSNLQMDAVDLGFGVCNLGLPPFVSSFFNISFSAQNLCLGDTTQFSLNSTDTIDAILWDFGDGFTSNQVNSSHQYTSAGNYNVSVTATIGTETISRSKSITISALPIVASTILNQAVCGSSGLSYDLSQFNNTLLGTQSNIEYGVAYFSNLTNATSHSNILNTIQSLSFGTITFYAKVFNKANTNCYAITNFDVSLFEQPIANVPNPMYLCDDSSNDGFEIFNLNSQNNSVLGTQVASNFSITYHLNQTDADNNSNALLSNYQNTVNPQTIFVRIENNSNPSCFATTSFVVEVHKFPVANTVQDLFICDDSSNDGFETFNLSNQNQILLGTQSSTEFAVTYHLSQADSMANLNYLPTNYTNTVNPQTIYVRIENINSPNCYTTTSFNLNVMQKPELLMDSSYTICQGIPIQIVAPNGYSSYLWSTGETTSAVNIAQAGSYTLTVTQDYGTVICDDTITIDVVNSNAATITNVEIQDWTDNENSIIVSVTGDGDYEYSIDGINYQDYNVFQGLISGDYNVFVRDKNGCGTSYQSIFLLMYPKFFTPNNDGAHDSWYIKNAINEPNMQLFIYDRFGKLLKQMSSLGSGWNGTYNGNQMPADDYWFIVKRQNGKEYRGHFTLKR